MTTRVNERDPPQITTSLRGAKRRGNPVVHRTSRKIDGIATPVCALARNDVGIDGWSFHSGLAVIAAERAILESPLQRER